MSGIASRGISAKGIASRGIAWIGVGANGGGVILPSLIQCLEGGVYGTFEVNDTLSPLVVTDRARYQDNACVTFPGTTTGCIANTGLQFDSSIDVFEIWGQLNTGALDGLDFIYGAESATKAIGLGVGATDWICDYGAKGGGATGIAFDGNPFIITMDGGVFTKTALDGSGSVVLKDLSAQADFTVFFDMVIAARNREDTVSEECPLDVFRWKWTRAGFVIQDCTFAETSGATILDRSGLSSHMTIQESDFSAVDAADLAAARAGRTDVGPPHNIENGCNIASVGNGSTDFINSGITVDADMYLEIDAEFYNGAGNWYENSQGYEYSATSFSRLLIGSVAGGFAFGYGGSFVNDISTVSGRQVAYVDAVKYGVDGAYTAWTPTASFANPGTMTVFRLYNHSRYCSGEVYRYTIGNRLTSEIYSNIVSRSDGTMFDTVSETVLFNRDLPSNSDPLDVRIIPSLASNNALDVYGDPIIHTASIFHNGAESLVEQTSAVFTAGTASFWSNVAGTSIIARSFSELENHRLNYNGSYGLWLSAPDANGIHQAKQYELGAEYTVAQWTALESRFDCVGDSGAVTDGGEIVTDGQYVVWDNYFDTP